MTIQDTNVSVSVKCYITSVSVAIESHI